MRRHAPASSCTRNAVALRTHDARVSRRDTRVNIDYRGKDECRSRSVCGHPMFATNHLQTMCIALILAATLAGCATSREGPGGNSAGLTDCPGGTQATTLTQAGSSTVLPIAERWAEEIGPCIGAR